MSVKTVRKKRRSLVRLLASCVPNFLWKYIFRVPPRMCISSSLIQKMSSLKQNHCPSDDSNTSFGSFKHNFQLNRNKHLILNSTPKKVQDVEDYKYKALQDELDEIKKMIAKLMERQSEQCSGYGTFSSPSDQLRKSSISPPCPTLPPPPPPPLPNFSLLPVNSPIITKKTKNAVPRNSFPCGKELLRELKKVQLKKIEKSPGGGPIKKTVNVVNDPGDILAAVLKKRFGFVQNSPDSSLESDSVDAKNSFGSGTIHSYNVQESSKITVS